MVSMLYKTNIFGIVGSDNNEEFKQKQVIIWDDSANKILYKIKMTENVLNLKMRRDKIFIVCLTKIYIVNTKNGYYLSCKKETGNNPNGLIAINYDEENTIIVYPSSDENKDKGEITIENLDNNEVKYLFPHKNKVAYIALSYNGLLLATASEDGKKIRIFETQNLEKLQELNRGAEKADIKCISIDFRNQFLAASSIKGTIHIWSLSQSIEKLKKSGKYKINDEDVSENKISNTFSNIDKVPQKYLSLIICGNKVIISLDYLKCIYPTIFCCGIFNLLYFVNIILKIYTQINMMFHYIFYIPIAILLIITGIYGYKKVKRNIYDDEFCMVLTNICSIAPIFSFVLSLIYKEKFENKWKKLDVTKPSHTLVAHLGKDTYSHIHPIEPRGITVREAARLQSFPDDFFFDCSMGDAFKQIGNAVPPLLAYGVAKTVLNTFEEE